MASRPIGSILALMAALKLFQAPSWNAWRAVLKAIYALPMSPADLALYQRVTDRTTAPTQPFREVWLIVGRRGGKSFITALVAVYQTTCRTFTLSAGETGVFMIIAADRRQARVIKGYIAGMLKTIGALESLLASETAETITLRNGLHIEIVTASFRTLRGYTCIGAACDEVAFWQNDDSANPDLEILAALRPAMATQPDALLVCITSPYARRGEAWKAFTTHFGQDAAPVLVVRADTRTMNSEVPVAIIEAAYADDPAHAAAEWGASFRTDVETFVSREVVDACVVLGRRELGPQRNVTYRAFVDPSGGSSDSMTLAIAHVSGSRIVVDLLREQLAPFDPDACVQAFAATLRTYRVSTVRGDRYSGEWARERFQKHGIFYRTADKTKSELYQALLPRLNAATIELLEHERATKQLLLLERRTARGGRDSIDHPPRGKDDVINVIAGVAHELRDGTQVFATVYPASVYNWRTQHWESRVEPVRDMMERCGQADREREESGEQDTYLRRSLYKPPTR
jgi:hypothetical protein